MFGVLLVIVWIWACFGFCCRACSCRKKAKKVRRFKPVCRTFWEWCSFVTFVLVSAGLITLAIYAYFWSTGIDRGVKRTGCGMSSFVVDIRDGNETLNWRGLMPTAQKLANMSL
eukprot:Filipodium_phascolosomae@DN4177_c0_g1_i1.p1